MSALPHCGYCLGERSDCTCTDDCGARGTNFDNDPAYCPRAEGYVDRLADTGFYSADELAALREQGYR